MLATSLVACASVAVPISAAVALTGVPTSRVDPGQHANGETFQLPAAAVVGQQAVMSVALDANATGTGTDGLLAVDVALARSVVGVDGDGGFSIQSTASGARVAQAPPGFDSSAFDGLDGVAIDQSFDRTGVPTGPGAVNSASDAQAIGGRQLVNWIGPTAVGFPADAVAVGASWSSPGRAGSVGGIVVDVEYKCRLASVTDRQYTLEVSFAQDFSVSGTPVGDVNGTISGWGTLSGSLDNPLVVNGSVNQSIDAMATSGGASSPLSVTSTLTVSSQG